MRKTLKTFIVWFDLKTTGPKNKTKCIGLKIKTIKKQDIYYFTSYISVSSKRLNHGPSNHRPLDAASVCEESRNGLQAVLHMCICVHIYVCIYMCLFICMCV